ncbi:SMAD/FHA domain-containing protein [Melanogaster broomeanus]|nr:SMAD/FHA domain-containing protein [Melanogaster broomeanus]
MEATSPVLINEALPVRSTILGSFLRGRPRGVSTSHPPAPTAAVATAAPLRQVSPSHAALSPPLPANPIQNTHRRRSFAPSSLIIPQSTNNNPQPTPVSSSGPSLGISHILRRRRSAGLGNNGNPTVNNNSNNNNAPTVIPSPLPTATPVSPTPPADMPLSVPPQVNRGPSSASSTQPHQAHRIRLVPHLDSRRTLRFEPITRDLKDDDPPLRIGRFTDRSGIGLNAANLLSSNKLAFKSKVVSRSHAEVWLQSGKFFIKDTKSSSGTFLNHLRLSPAGQESRPYQLRDGDILQLGVDYQGGSEDIYKSVKIKIEVGREWQAGANAFNMHAISQLKSLAVSSDPTKIGDSKESSKGKQRLPKTNIPDCCICLFAVTIHQALFISPCSHAFHYKCIRPLLEKHTSAFSCPLCRSFADLDEDVEVEPEPEAEEDDAEWEDVGAAQSALAPTSNSPARLRDGAETEVETDVVGNGHRSRRPRTTFQRMNVIGDSSEQADCDAEMIDGDVEEGEMYVDDGDSQSHDENPPSAFVTRGAGFGLPLPGTSGARDDVSEGDGSRSVSGEGGMGAEVVEHGADGEPIVSGKRKR